MMRAHEIAIFWLGLVAGAGGAAVGIAWFASILDRRKKSDPETRR